MRSSRWIAESHFLLACRAGLAERRVGEAGNEPAGTKFRLAILLVLVTAALAAIPVAGKIAISAFFWRSLGNFKVTIPVKLDLTYVRPTERTKVSNYTFDAFGPYPVAGAGVAAGINQWTNSPPEWGQGAEGFGKRFGSDFAIAAIGTTTRYGLAEAFREDTLYYRCECSGPFPRLRHAVISTLTGRRGEDGHRVFSFSALAAPYAGSMIAVYLWYPDRFDGKGCIPDGQLQLAGVIWAATLPWSFSIADLTPLISRMHLNNAHGSPDSGPKPMSDRGFTPVAGLNPPLPVRRTDAHILFCRLRHEAVQRLFRVVRQPGHLFLAGPCGPRLHRRMNGAS